MTGVPLERTGTVGAHGVSDARLSSLLFGRLTFVPRRDRGFCRSRVEFPFSCSVLHSWPCRSNRKTMIGFDGRFICEVCLYLGVHMNMYE
jgi:hypothetical protein